MIRFGYPVVATLTLMGANAAFAQTQDVVTVDGRILSSDGSRVLYVPTSNPNDLRIRLGSGQDQVVVANAPYTPAYGYLTPSGAVFAADVASQLMRDLFTYNGATPQLVSYLNSSNSLISKGNYSVFSGNMENNTGYDNVYLMNNSTGQVIMAPGDNGNQYLDVTPQGVIAYWSGGNKEKNYNIMTFDGVTARAITNTVGVVRNFYPLTDGVNFLFSRTVGEGSPSLILSDGTTETVLRTSTDTALNPGGDYQINAGWVAYRQTNGTLMLRSPAGVTTTIGASWKILSVSENGEIAYTIGTETFLRRAGGEIFDIGTYSSAFNVGSDWYFYAGGRLVRYLDGQLVALDAAFASNGNPYVAAAGATLYGVSDITVPRAIAFSGQTTLDTHQFNVTLSGALSGAGSLDVSGGGTLTLLRANSYTGGTSIAGATLIGNTASLQGMIANAGTLVFDQSVNGTFQGILSGNGTMRKVGAGTLTLAGAQPFAGTVVLDSGGLRLQALDTPAAFQLNGGALSGTGRIGALTAVGGTIRPGAPGTVITSTGPVTLGVGAVYVADLASGGPATQLATLESATLNGSRLVLSYVAGRYRLGDSWTILTAGGGVSGTFGTVDAPTFGLLSPSVGYGPLAVTVQLVLNRQAFVAIAATPNQAQAASAAAQLPVTSRLLGELVTLPADGIRPVLTSLSGDIHASTVATIADAAAFADGAVMDRLRERNGTIWGSAGARRATTRGFGDVAGNRTNGRNFIAGADQQLLPGLSAGVAGWYGDADTTGWSGKLDYTQAGVGLYAGADYGALTLRVMASRTWYDMHTDRRVSFNADTNFSERLTGQSGATSNEFALETGIDNSVGPVTITPFAGVRYQKLDFDSLQEAGGESALLAKRKSSSRTLGRTGLDGKLEARGPLPASIRVSAAWEHALSRLDAGREMTWPAAGGAEFAVLGIQAPKDVFDGSVSTEVAVSNWRLGATARYTTGSNFDAVSARLTASLDL
ncbi:autotransporter domain-containing protein [Sphingomonas sp. JC676]|uniref:autotransporter outer membrane beta-barrel domain-containing protein n=1 Tax=Sphingomonas sp. JC676 TaxID=2768065 RepID=UPI0016584849|nr:autotransporter domain-containing protein [Sphingomonas sp. JC676]MBC9034131.1 autotransporter domain-containing protein [Sphingomonas sp. JC676]